MRHQVTIAALVLAAALAGCSTVPIMNVAEAPVVAPNGKTLNHDDVKKAILRAGGTLGWQMTEEGPNMVVGTLNLRAHTAVVEIPYSARAYSIKYRSSVNLEEKGGTIHKNYNGWIQNLQKAINVNLATS